MWIVEEIKEYIMNCIGFFALCSISKYMETMNERIEKLETACRMKDDKNGVRTLEYDIEIINTRLDCIQGRL